MQAPANSETKTTSKKETTTTVRVKFNFAFANPTYDFQKALTKVDEKKNLNAYFQQRQIDFRTKNSVYEPGKCYDINENLFTELSQKFVKTFNPVFGEFKPLFVDGKEKASEKVAMLEIPYVLKVDSNNKVLDRWESERFDLYP